MIEPRKIACIVSNLDKAIAFEWIIQNMNAEKIKLHFIILNSFPSYLQKFCHENNIPCEQVHYTSKKNLPVAALKIRKILKKWNIHTVHCHLVDAALAGLWAAKSLGIKQRIYSRHHADFHHIYFPRAVRYDKWINKMATRIVAVSNLVRNILINKENVSPEKVLVIEHGFDLSYFKKVKASEINLMRKKYQLLPQDVVVGVISRYIELKGVQYIIPAIKTLLLQYPDVKLMLANVSGSYKDEIKKLISELPPDRVIEIIFENNNAALYKLFSVFVHVPVGPTVEAFGQTYIETMAAGIPLVCTSSGIGNDILLDGVNCLQVAYKNSHEIALAIEKIISNRELSEKLVSGGYETIHNRFALKTMINNLEKLYAE